MNNKKNPTKNRSRGE